MTLLVLGIDGAVREYVEEAIDRGLMPNMENLIDEGFFGDMKSTVPPVTIPAWVSIFSGQRPDRFDTYHLTELDEDRERFTAPSERWRGDMVWDRIDGRFGLNSVPGNSPVWPLDGYAVEGLPMAEDPGVYPGSLREKLPPLEYPDHGDVPDGEQKREVFRQIFEKKKRVFSETPDDVDVKIEIYHLPDRMGHAADRKSHILEAYGMMDEVIGQKIEEYDNILAISDHGFKQVERCFYPNAWLRDNGYLELEQQGSATRDRKEKIQRIAKILADTPLRPLLKKMNDLVSSSTGVELSPDSTGIEDIDFDRTEAFSYRAGSLSYADININHEVVQGKEAGELRQQLKKGLEQVDGVEKVWLAEEIYEEPENMPELVVKTAENVATGSAIFPEQFLSNDAFVHSDTGIVAASGPAFREGQLEEVEIIDVAPTIAEYLGQELACDGEPLDVFREGFRPVEPSESEVEDIEF
ncbi:MAG: alkaline phosphatase family protein [Candidatus Nanohaloarchaea archaeon]